jgi:coatomer protein complex subunit gamma
VGFLANFLREEGGFDFKKAIVDAIVTLICAIPETKESSLFHLCEFIEDCEFTALSTQILHLVGSLAPTTTAPARYIRFVYNRVILENAVVRAGAVTALSKFAAKLPILRASVSVLLRRSLRDEDDEVRDRATFALRLLGDDLESVLSGETSSPDNMGAEVLDDIGSDNETLSLQPSHSGPIIMSNEEIHLLLEPFPLAFPNLSLALKKFEAEHGCEQSTRVLTMATLPIVEDTRPATQSKVPSATLNPSTREYPAEELYKVPELAGLGPVFLSTASNELTEVETEYVVSYVKHVMDDYVVLEFAITNTIVDQLLVDACVTLETADDGVYTVVRSIAVPEMRCGIEARCWLVLKRNKAPGHSISAQFVAELKFRVIEIDPVSGDIEGDEDGFPEEYPLEDVELSTADFIRKVTDADFRSTWESLGLSGEVLEKFGLQFKDLNSATAAVIDCLGMEPQGSEQSASILHKKGQHSINLAGVFVGGVRVLARAQLQLDEQTGCILKLAVRSPSLEVSRLIADCIK